MISAGQKFFTIGALLAAMVPGQRVVLADSASAPPRASGRVMRINSRTLRNVLSRANTARGRGDPRDLCHIAPDKVVQSIWDKPQLVVRYDESLVGTGGLFSLKVEMEDKLTLGAGDSVVVIECLRRSTVDSEPLRLVDGVRLTNEFFKLTSDAGRIREFGTAMGEQQLAIATDSLRKLGITELLAATLKRLDEARFIKGVGSDIVQLPVRRVWLRAIAAVYGADTSWTDAELVGSTTNEWYSKHVLDRGMRWCDFGLALKTARLGNGTTNVLEADYVQLRLACLRAGVTMTGPDSTAGAAKTTAASSDVGPVLDLLTVAAGVDIASAFVAPLLSQDKHLIAGLEPQITSRRGAGLLSDRVHFIVPSERASSGPECFMSQDGTAYYAALLTNVKLTVTEAIAVASLAVEDYHGRVSSGQTPLPVILKVGHALSASTYPVQRFDVPRTDVVDQGQPADALWFDGCDMELTVPTTERMKDAFEGVGVWATIDGNLLYREVFGLPGHPEALSGDEFTAAVEADLDERGMEWAK